ncbi:MAG TPA: AmmeMemoRadiSam system protein B [Terriglobales bacterium]|jgi:AmmeMemoRadiSam system protein B|nr:AmmeMemoRadiSam system protein B [Terriglobales bacterium]
MESTVRRPAVAGRFYPGDPSVLLADVRSYLSPTEKTISAIGCVVPHAGYIYSGHVAGAVFARLNIPQRCIVLCPNHTGMGQPLAIMSAGAWETPLGKVAIDSSLADALKQRFPQLTEDADAHRAEHAAEVELPFLQAECPNVTFVPIALGTAKFDVLENLGQAIADVVKAEAEPVLIVASSDMNHYESDKITRVKDRKAIERILALDARGLFDVVMNEDISMCGFGPTVTMLTAAKRLGGTTAELIKYATSGDISGDREMVVGYAGVVVR